MTSRRIGAVATSQRPKVTLAEVERWRELAVQGLSPHEIAVRTGRSHSTISDYLLGRRVAGVRKRRGPPPEVGPVPGCVECAAWAAAVKSGRVAKLRRCPRHGGG